MTRAERKAAFAELNPDVQRDVWVVHLERFLASIPSSPPRSAA